MEYIHAVCHGMTMFYPGGAEQFLEAVLSISERVRGIARKSGRTTSTHAAEAVVGQ
jgi:hypothetical protein